MRTRAFLPPTLLLTLVVWCTACKSTSSTPASSDTSSSQSASQTASNPPAPVAPGAAPAPAEPSSSTPPASPGSPEAPPAAAAPTPPVESAPPPPPPPVVIPAGTTLRVRLVQPVGSKISDPGQSFDATVSSPIVVKGATLIPAGTRAVGTVTEAHASGRFKGGATLSLRLNSFRLNGSTFAINTATYAQT